MKKRCRQNGQFSDLSSSGSSSARSQEVEMKGISGLLEWEVELQRKHIEFVCVFTLVTVTLVTLG